MKIPVEHAETVVSRFTLTEPEARRVVKQYVETLLGGPDRYIENGKLMSWTSWPHGSGTTAEHGTPTVLQQTAWDFWQALVAAPAVEAACHD